MNKSQADKIESPGVPREGKVAKILSPTQVVLNFGEQHGAKVGSRYNIVLSLDVPDPDDPSTTIQTLSYVKGVVEVVKVLQLVSVAQPPEHRTRKLLQQPSALGALGMMRPQYEETVVRPELNIDPTQVALSDNDRRIRVGDAVALVAE